MRKTYACNTRHGFPRGSMVSHNFDSSWGCRTRCPNRSGSRPLRAFTALISLRFWPHCCDCWFPFQFHKVGHSDNCGGWGKETRLHYCYSPGCSKKLSCINICYIHDNLLSDLCSIHFPIGPIYTSGLDWESPCISYDCWTCMLINNDHLPKRPQEHLAGFEESQWVMRSVSLGRPMWIMGVCPWDSYESNFVGSHVQNMWPGEVVIWGYLQQLVKSCNMFFNPRYGYFLNVNKFQKNNKTAPMFSKLACCSKAEMVVLTAPVYGQSDRMHPCLQHSGMWQWKLWGYQWRLMEQKTITCMCRVFPIQLLGPKPKVSQGQHRQHARPKWLGSRATRLCKAHRWWSQGLVSLVLQEGPIQNRD